MQGLFKLAVAAALIAYPVAIYFAADWFTPSQFIAGLLLLLMLRLMVLAWFAPVHRVRHLALAALLLAAALVVLKWLPTLGLNWLRLYPMLFNLGAFAVFLGSLFTPQPLVERMARLVHPDLPPQAIPYTRRVTQIWCMVLLLNTLVTGYTAFGVSLALWTLYNGIGTYLLFGIVFLVEYLWRSHLKRKWALA